MYLQTKVTGWFQLLDLKRQFPIDMAGFAVNIKLIIDQVTAEFSLTAGVGMQETYFLSRIVTQSELEPKADNCTRVRN